MTAEQLAAKMHAAWRRAMHDPSAHPAWGNLPTEDRGAWIAAAKVATTHSGFPYTSADGKRIERPEDWGADE